MACRFRTSSDERVHFGLGAAKEARVQIAWPSGIQQVLTNVKADWVLTVREEGVVPPFPSTAAPAVGPKIPLRKV